MIVQVEMETFSPARVKWRGWSTTLAALRAHGWNITAYHNQYTKRYTIQFRNNESRLIGAVNVSGFMWDELVRYPVNACLEIKEIYAEHNGRMPKPRVMNPEKPYTADDIPALLELINELQKPARERYIEETILPVADVLEFKARYGISLDEQVKSKKKA